MRRLGLGALASFSPRLRPRVDPATLGIGIVHLGLGAFHRAHQAVYTEEAVAASGDRRWGICGVSPRGSRAADDLRRQDGLYTLFERGAGAAQPRIIGSVRRVLSAMGERDAVVAAVANADAKVATLTVTEQGYAPGSDVVPLLCEGLRARAQANGEPLTVLCCDNIPANGPFLRERVLAACAGEAELSSWIDECVSFPSSVVDRIVPAQEVRDVDEASTLLGVADRCAISAEPFSQWVIEDRFLAGRPAWEIAGAVMTTDATPYQIAKLRLLNGAHSALAYLGALAGYELIADAIEDTAFERFLGLLMSQEIAPTLTAPSALNLAGYAETIRARFANRALGHRCIQVCSDGTLKLPIRLLPSVRERLQAGAPVRLLLLSIAAWMRFVATRRSDAGAPLAVVDPAADALLARTRGAATPDAVVDRLLSFEQVFDRELGTDADVRRTLVGWLTLLEENGARAAALEATGADG